MRKSTRKTPRLSPVKTDPHAYRQIFQKLKRFAVSQAYSTRSQGDLHPKPDVARQHASAKPRPDQPSSIKGLLLHSDSQPSSTFTSFAQLATSQVNKVKSFSQRDRVALDLRHSETERALIQDTIEGLRRDTFHHARVLIANKH